MSDQLRVLSLGAGVQSTTLALMAMHGEIEAPNYVIFADTGDEKRRTYEHLDWMEQTLPFPVIRLRRCDMSLSESTLALYRDGSGKAQTPPFFTADGMFAKHCSKEWKTRVVNREIRRLIGLQPGQRGPSDYVATVIMGISREEAHRMKPSEMTWARNVYPLIDMDMRRYHCERWLTDRGYPIPPRSACVYCSFQSDAEFEDMKRHHNQDDDWSRIVAFDEAVRPGGNGTYGPLYVHRSCQPIADVSFASNQPSLFGNECEGTCGS